MQNCKLVRLSFTYQNQYVKIHHIPMEDNGRMDSIRNIFLFIASQTW